MVLGAAIAVLGVAIVVQTLAAGTGVLAGRLIIGVLFIAAGIGRIVLERGRDR
jgi:hypothetical protein